MSGWDKEWATLRARARADIARQRTPDAAPVEPDLSVPVDQLLTSATASEGLHEHLRPALDRAVTDLTAAAESVRHWTFGEELTRSATGWDQALTDLADRLPEHATGLRALTTAMVGLDQEIHASFRGWGTV
ncbi:hypothetical protein [Streptomyces hainanensis]|uniref:Uncharacterized protein n=1 Tax=Streptomyces hainanensis TaxID=402648 RepID=A0A4R4SQW1_9ACTN|nr:hypothetical protein [Streptomyces hainanensis]TDC64572.1 hypothetical protein E1283_31435 [Streptomyces hainanensis]